MRHTYNNDVEIGLLRFRFLTPLFSRNMSPRKKNSPQNDNEKRSKIKPNKLLRLLLLVCCDTVTIVHRLFSAVSGFPRSSLFNFHKAHCLKKNREGRSTPIPNCLPLCPSDFPLALFTNSLTDKG